MNKPAAIAWLETETGEAIAYQPERIRRDRHLSVRVDAAVGEALEAIADERNQTLSQLVRDVITELVDRRRDVALLDTRQLVDRLAADVEEIARRLAG